jgi:hypothetical protein
MSASEISILRQFRRFQIRPSQMMFFPTGQGKGSTREFTSAMNSLIKRGMVVPQRHKGAYSLTPSGYQASLSAERQTMDAPRKATKTAASR